MGDWRVGEVVGKWQELRVHREAYVQTQGWMSTSKKYLIVSSGVLLKLVKTLVQVKVLRRVLLW